MDEFSTTSRKHFIQCYLIVLKTANNTTKTFLSNVFWVIVLIHVENKDRVSGTALCKAQFKRYERFVL